MSRVLAIAGSARRGGNSDSLLEAALDVLRARGAEVRTIIPRELHVEPCRSCGGCQETGVCVISDALRDMYHEFAEADHIVVGSPVYFTSLPGHLKVLIDRFQCLWVRTFRLADPPQPRRRGMFLCIGAMRRQKFYACSRSVVAAWMACLNMECAVSRFFPGLDAPHDQSKFPDYLEEARKAAEELLGGGA
jgi:multimeric flavodoxin WrbA